MNYYLDLKDERIIIIKDLLDKKGYTTYDFWRSGDNISSDDIVILSPALRLNTTQASLLPPSCSIFASKQSSDVMEILSRCTFYDYALDEDYAMHGAMLTAENFLPYLIENTSQSIYDEKILIIGGGRVARSLWSILSKLSVPFIATMRNDKQLAESRLFANDSIPLDQLNNILSDYSVVINTVPALLFDHTSVFSPSCILFELSSIPCTSDANVKVVACRALPSRFAPITAGQLLFNSIENRLKSQK